MFENISLDLFTSNRLHVIVLKIADKKLASYFPSTGVTKANLNKTLTDYHGAYTFDSDVEKMFILMTTTW